MHSPPTPRRAGPNIVPFRARSEPPPGVPSLYNLDAEAAVLGAVLLNREAIVAIAAWLRPERFYLAKHAQIYSAALSCHQAQTPPDVVAVAEALRRAGQLESVGGMPALVQLLDGAPTSYHVEHYAEIVETLGWRRQAADALARLAALAYDETKRPVAVIADIQEAVTGLRDDVRYGRHQVPGRHISQLWQQLFPPIQYVVDGLLMDGMFTILSGKPKLGKSLLALDVAAAVAAGGVALGTAPVTTPGDVLYLCLEDPERILQSRLEALLRGRPDLPFWYETEWPALDAGGIERLDLWLREHASAKLIVVDTLSAVAPAPDGKKSAYQADYDALKHLRSLSHSYNVPVIGVTHSRKADAADVLDEVSGTSGKTGAGDNIWVLRRGRGESAAELHVILRGDKSTERALAFDDQRASWTLGGSAIEVREGSVRAAVLDALLDGPQYPRDVAEIAGADRAQVRKHLRALMHAGLIEQDDRSRYRVTDAGRRQAELSCEADHPDHPDHPDQGGSPGSPGSGPGSPPPTWRAGVFDEPDPILIRPDPPDPPDPGDPGDPTDDILAPAPPRERMFLRLYLRGTKSSDQAEARRRCARYGIDYQAAYQAVNQTSAEPPEPDE